MRFLHKAIRNLVLFSLLSPSKMSVSRSNPRRHRSLIYTMLVDIRCYLPYSVCIEVRVPENQFFLCLECLTLGGAHYLVGATSRLRQASPIAPCALPRALPHTSRPEPSHASGFSTVFLLMPLFFQGSVRNTALGTDFTILRLLTCPKVDGCWPIPTSSSSLVRKGDCSIL